MPFPYDKPPLFLYRLPLAWLADFYLEPICPCDPRTTYLPLKMIATFHPGARCLGDVLIRLRCQTCGKAPATLALCENPYGKCSHMMGTLPGWRLEWRAPVLERWPYG